MRQRKFTDRGILPLSFFAFYAIMEVVKGGAFMLKENSIFLLHDADKQLLDSRKSSDRYRVTPEVIDFEMQFHHDQNQLKIHAITQEGLEYFVTHYGKSYKVLTFWDARLIYDFSPLADLRQLEAVRLDWCRNTDKLWDFSNNSALRILSITSAKKICENPMLLQTSQTLEEVRLWGGDFDSKYTLDSMECFRGMPALRRIDLNDIKLRDKSMDVLNTLPSLEEFHFDAGMLTTEEIAWIVAKHPNLYGDCLGPYTYNEVTCLNDVRVCGNRKPGLDLPKDQKRLDKYIAEFEALVERYRHGK